MSLAEIVIIAVGLAMDAFAVSITLGLSVKKPKPVEIMIPGLYFVFFSPSCRRRDTLQAIFFVGRLGDWIIGSPLPCLGLSAEK